jgi:S1-C subfamily serine protease
MQRRHRLFSITGKCAFALVFLLCIQMVHAQTTQRIAKTAFASTVLLAMWDANRQPVALGSGFVVGDGLIATNYHVIEGASGGTAKFVGVTTTYRIEGIVASDPARDLVILQVPFISGPKSLRIGDSDAVQIGDTVYAVGNPLGLEGTFSQGIISGIRSVETDSLIQITAAISPGSSGGPVLDSSGAVVGVAVATFKGGQNLNFAALPEFMWPRKPSFSSSWA